MEHTIHALEEAGVRDQVKVFVGGAPVTQEFADQIGADAYASNAAAASEIAKKLVGAA
jgi:5-methyltetrahydrofolate--homocysteine methyltransferase